MIVRRAPSSREEWLAWRRDVVTASQVGWLYDISPYGSPLKLYAEKSGVEFNQKDNPILRRGRWLEPGVAEACRELRPDWRIESNKDPHTGLPVAFYADAEVGIGGTPDFFISGDPRGLGVLQAKTVSPWIFSNEWDQGRAAPEWIVLQCAVEMMLTDAAFGAIAVLTIEPAAECYIIDVARNRDAEASILTRVAQFWQDFRAGRDPDPNPDKDAAVVRALYPHSHEGAVIDFSGDNRLPQLLARRADLCAEIKGKEAEVEAIETELKFAMGEAERATGIAGWRIIFKSLRRDGYTVAPNVIRPLRIYDQRHESDAGAA